MPKSREMAPSEPEEKNIDEADVIVKQKGDQETPQSSEGKEGEEDDKGNKPEKGESTEEHLSKIDGALDELIDKVKDAPELKKKALEICIQQFCQIAEQMKQVRDMKNLHELKKLMMDQWEELNELAGGDPELLAAIQEWGNEFIDQKVIYYDILGDAKDELLDRAQDVEETWNNMLASLSSVEGGIPASSRPLEEFLKGKAGDIFAIVVNGGDFPSNQDNRTPGDIFFENINDPESFYNGDGLMVEEASKFVAGLNKVISKLFSELQNQISLAIRAQTMTPETKQLFDSLGETLKGAMEKKDQLSKQIREISKSFKFVKKVKDTHFLKGFNKQPE